MLKIGKLKWAGTRGCGMIRGRSGTGLSRALDYPADGVGVDAETAILSQTAHLNQPGIASVFISSSAPSVISATKRCAWLELSNRYARLAQRIASRRSVRDAL